MRTLRKAVSISMSFLKISEAIETVRYCDYISNFNLGAGHERTCASSQINVSIIIIV